MDNFLLELTFILLALILVLTIAWFLLKGLKRFHNVNNNSDIKLTLSIPVGTKERIVILTYRGNEYLVGITQGGMNLLDKLQTNNNEVISKTDKT